MSPHFNIGLDAGSTTIKVVVTDKNGDVLYKNYKRHLADIPGTVLSLFEQLKQKFGEETKTTLAITGSTGMGIAERCRLPFVQEVVALCEVIKIKFPETKTLVDIGGEDAKMIFFSKNHVPDMRMNGSCAGGTGAFIDQMASLLNVEIDQLNALAENATTIYPIASRCGVFSKTDVQNLLSRNISREDIAASIFHAVSMQVITSLARGYEIKPLLFICGGPFSFIPALRKAFIKEIQFSEQDVVLSENSKVVPAWGASIHANKITECKTIGEYIQLIQNSFLKNIINKSNKLKPLFNSEEEHRQWLKTKDKYHLPKTDIANLKGTDCFIGIDSGSTTTKIIALDAEGRLFYHFYEKNKGNSLQTVTNGLQQLAEKTKEKNLRVAGSCVTGYGEDLIKAAFPVSFGMVETIAHYSAAYKFNPDVSFILDIGGQDMKATFIENGIIKRLEINEACSSGCGSFIETFAESLKYSSSEFSEMAITAKHPCDLGTRCTVFMNSKVKQSLREGSSIPDIAAGIGYSVIKNCLNKVLKLKDTKLLGNNIMVQGGTFKNHAVLRAFELETGKTVMVTDFPELMGAYGAALYAIENIKKQSVDAIELKDFVQSRKFTGKITVCKGCENQCTVTTYQFDTGKRYFAGNKCEKIFTNKGNKKQKGENIYLEKHDALFTRSTITQGKLRLGIPRSLGIYEDYPFWFTLFSSCGIEVVLSDPSTMKLYEKGIGTVMADNICFPAKLANGHILNLIEKKVDRIFMPFVVYDKKEDKNTVNSYNCPIVTGYSEVIKSAINPESKYSVPFDAPSFTFADERLLKKSCIKYLQKILPGISFAEINHAFKNAVNAQHNYETHLTNRCQEILDNAIKNNRLVVILTGRPYHTDPLIQHKISEIIAGFGADVISEDIVRNRAGEVQTVQSVMQWAYTNRIFKAAQWAAQAPANVHYIEMTSFGCGPDSFILDEVNDILQRNGRNATFLKVDDINNIGSTRLRIRSLVESLQFKHEETGKTARTFIQTPAFEKKDRKRKLLLPWFADFYSPFIPPALNMLGYDAENLPPSNKDSAEFGLKYSNNEVCYPATLIIGDFIKALKSGKYKHDEIALAITQTGGQCRATNYIALIKKAMLSAGINDIPVISVSAAIGQKAINNQPGFKIKWMKIARLVISCIAYADCLSQLYYATAPREKIPGIARELKDKYIRLGIEAMKENNTEIYYELARKAAKEFESVNTLEEIPRIGIVGEIFVKYNCFAHDNVVNWLIEKKVEPVLPAFSEFVTVAFPNEMARVEGFISEKNSLAFMMKWVEEYIFKIIRKMESCVNGFPYFHAVPNPHQDAQNASRIINLNAQFGEGWNIPAEFARFAENGINNVVSLQPFGCIANQIISKGIEKRVRELYPSLNLLFLDFDSGMSEANIFNRLYFLLQNARSEMKEYTNVNSSEYISFPVESAL